MDIPNKAQNFDDMAFWPKIDHFVVAQAFKGQANL